MKIDITIEDIREMVCDKAADQGWCDKVDDCHECCFDDTNIEYFRKWARDNIAPVLGSYEGLS